MDSINAIELEDSISHRNPQTEGSNQVTGPRRQSAYEAQRVNILNDVKHSLNGNQLPNGTIPQTQSTNMARSSTHEVPDVFVAFNEQQNQSFEFARQSLISTPHSSRTQSLTQLMSLLQTSSLDRIFTQLIKSIQDDQEEHAKKILEHIAYQKVSIVNVMDPKRSTVIHLACIKKLASLVKAFVTYEISLGTNVRYWLNERNMDFFAPVHYAAYTGSIQILDILKENGADLRITNQLGQNALCVAAQGDQVSAMLWLQINGLSFLDTDEKGGSPLHWATYYGSEHAVAFLLAWICKENQRQVINLQDQEGQAPLHLAAMTGNMRIAKKLLLRGANKSLRESLKQQTPAEVAKDNNFDQLHDFLDSTNCLMEFFNLKTSFKPISFNWEQMITFFIVYFYCLGATIVFVYPFFNNDHIYQYVSMFLFGLGIVFYFLTWLVSPGYIRKNTNQELLFDLLNQNEPWEICAECQIKKPKRSRHCEICKRCVAVFDHHCPWVNNCIGANNHLIFIIFLITIVLNLLHVIILNAMYIYRDYQGENLFYTWFNNFYTSHTLYIIKVVCQSLVLILSLFVIPVSLLLRLHLDNIFSNKTTFERNKCDANAIKSPSVTTLSTSTQSQPNKKVRPWSASNCTAMCCRNKYNKEYYN